MPQKYVSDRCSRLNPRYFMSMFFKAFVTNVVVGDGMSFGFVCLLIVFLFLFLLLFRQVKIIRLMRRNDNRTMITVAVTTYIFILSMLKTIILLYHGRLLAFFGWSTAIVRLVHSPFPFLSPHPCLCLLSVSLCTVIPREVFFFVCLFVVCLSSQQHASVSQGRICSDNCTSCHTVADPTFHLT